MRPPRPTPIPPSDEVADVAVRAVGLGHDHGEITALRGVDLTLPAGRVLAVLGHNGAGKSTLVRILSGRLRPTRGHATVRGHDVARDPAAVRRQVGVVDQEVALDPKLSGRANLVLLARLLGGGRAARPRAEELLEQFDLVAAADRPVWSWSGGMRRRLDLAAGLLDDPQVLFLDEPTTGLDPVARRALWDTVAARVAEGMTVLLTTQYLEEADRLADELVVLRNGSVIGAGGVGELKSAVGSRTATLTLDGPPGVVEALGARIATAGWRVTSSAERSCVHVVVDDTRGLPALLALAGAGDAELTGLEVHEPSLDDVYLALHDRSVVDPVAR